MKNLLFAACLLSCPHFVANLSAQTALINQEVKNVNGTGDVTVNATLPAAPPTFNLSGPLTGTAAFFISVTATTVDGLSSYSGGIDPITNNYLVKVPAGTYQLSVSYIGSLTAVTGISTYNDPATVQVVADTVRPITVLPTPMHNISGIVSGLDPRLTSTSLIFSSTAANAGLSVNFAKLKADGTYTGSLPDGTYAALLASSTKDTSRLTSSNLGSFTVAGADLTMNFSAPALSSLSGTVQTSDGTAILTGSSVIGLDGNLLSIQNASNGNYPLFSFGSGAIDTASGYYQLLLPTGRQYTLGVGLSILAAAAPQESGSLELILPNTTQLAGDTAQDILVPALPGTVTVSGQVTDPTGAPVAGATVSATSAEVTGFPSNTAFFTRGTQTDSSGNYRLTVLNGSNYDLLFSPPVNLLSGSSFLISNRVKRVQETISLGRDAATPSPDKGLFRLRR